MTHCLALTRTVLVVWLSLLLGGCYFNSGIKIDYKAYLHANSQPMQSVEIREVSWFTGNMHIPFDFTVYEQAHTYELKAPRIDGLFTEKDIELWLCGNRLSGVTGTAQLSANQLSVDLEFGPPEKRHKLKGSFTVVPATEMPRICGESKR